MPTALQDPLFQLVLAAVLGALGVMLLLPKPQRQSRTLGVFLAMAGLAVFGAFLYTAFGRPMSDSIADVLFCIFAAVALLSGTLLVTQRNPARGAIAFAFVILSTCGLFLLLAAPFLMAATIIIYMGAIIVTFLFVLMLSHVVGPSDENDRSREPLLGSLAGFAFIGLICFTLLQGHTNIARAETALPQPMLTANDRSLLAEASADFDRAIAAEEIADAFKHYGSGRAKLLLIVGQGELNSEHVPVRERLSAMRTEPRTMALLKQTEGLRVLANSTDDKLLNAGIDLNKIRSAIKLLRDQTVIYSGNGQLPARNVANIGYILYSEHILSVELAGTLLLVATIGAVTMTQRRKEATA